MRFFIIIFSVLFIGCKNQEQISNSINETTNIELQSENEDGELETEKDDSIMKEFLEAGYEQACVPSLSMNHEGLPDLNSKASSQAQAIDYVLQHDARVFIKNICDTGTEFISCFKVTDRHYKGCGQTWMESIKHLMNDPSDVNTVQKPLLGNLDVPLLDHVVKILGFNNIEELQNTLPKKKDIKNYIYSTNSSLDISINLNNDTDEDTEILNIVKCFSQAFACQL